MKNKKKSNNGILCKLLAIVFLIPTTISAFLNIFSLTSGNDSSSRVLENYKLFANYDNAELGLALYGKEIQTIWMLINNIALLALITLTVIYVVAFVLQVLKVKSIKVTNKFMNIIGLIILVCSIIMLGSGTIATIVNYAEQSLIVTTYIEIAGAIGLFLQIPSLVGGILASFSKK